MTREPNPSIVLLITSLSLATYIFFPPIFFDMSSKAIMLAYIRGTRKIVNDTKWTCNYIALGCSFLLLFYRSNMSLRTFKRFSNIALAVLSALLVVFVSQAVRKSVLIFKDICTSNWSRWVGIKARDTLGHEG
jgi:hypothetical protein